jgi:hypothetical protein
MTTKHFSSNYQIRSNLERSIMCRMVCEGSLKLPSARGSDEGETKKAARARKMLVSLLTADGDCEQQETSAIEPIIYPVPAWVTCLLDPTQGVTPSEMAEILRAEEILQWTADGKLNYVYVVGGGIYFRCIVSTEPDVRTPETANRNSKTRTRRSVFDGDIAAFGDRFRDLIAEADECRRLLLTEKPELVKRYRDQN